MEHSTRFTSYKGYGTFRWNLKITSNMRLTPPCLDQNVNYDAVAHKSWQINNSFQFSIAISFLGSSEIEIYILPE